MRYASLLPPAARRSLILASLTPTTTARQSSRRWWSIGIGIVGVAGALRHSPPPPSSISVGRRSSPSWTSRAVPVAFADNYTGGVGGFGGGSIARRRGGGSPASACPVSFGRSLAAASSSSSSEGVGDYSGEVAAAAEEPLTGWLHSTGPKYRPPTADDAATRR